MIFHDTHNFKNENHSISPSAFWVPTWTVKPLSCFNGLLTGYHFLTPQFVSSFKFFLCINTSFEGLNHLKIPHFQTLGSAFYGFIFINDLMGLGLLICSKQSVRFNHFVTRLFRKEKSIKFLRLRSLVRLSKLSATQLCTFYIECRGIFSHVVWFH